MQETDQQGQPNSDLFKCEISVNSAVLPLSVVSVIVAGHLSCHPSFPKQQENLWCLRQGVEIKIIREKNIKQHKVGVKHLLFLPCFPGPALFYLYSSNSFLTLPIWKYLTACVPLEPSLFQKHFIYSQRISYIAFLTYFPPSYPLRHAPFPPMLNQLLRRFVTKPSGLGSSLPYTVGTQSSIGAWWTNQRTDP